MSPHPPAHALTIAVVLVTLASAAAANPPILGHNTCYDMPFIIPGPPPPIGEPTAILRFETPYTEVSSRPSCAGNFPVYNDIWVEFQAASTAYMFDLCGPSTAQVPDLLATVYRYTNPSSPCSTRVEIACIDDTPDCGGGLPGQPAGRLPRLRLYGLVPGDNYAVQVIARGFGGTECDTPPCTQGDYTLSIYPIDPPPCTLDVPPSIPAEGEPNPCSLETRTNDGCLLSPPGFSTIALGESRHGTSFNDGVLPDEDWYRVLVAPPGTLLTMSLRAEFDGEMQIVTHAPGQLCVQTVAASSTFADCGPTQYLTASVGGGEHFLVVRPTSLIDCQDPHRNYQLSVTADPMLPVTGACCSGTTCFQEVKAACWAIGYAYYGDLVECDDIACVVCPPAAIAENEPMICPAHGYVDSFNGGCDFFPPSPPLSQASFATPYCAISGTMYNAPPPDNTQNQRDSDWWRFNLSGVPVGEQRRIAVHLLTEFPAQVMIVNPRLGAAPCIEWDQYVVATDFVTPGIPSTVAACVTKRMGSLFLGDVWVIIRPATFGPPSEIPCGVRYTFEVGVELCTQPGACCLIAPNGVSGGCQMLTETQCAAQGGRFFGENVPCTNVCCPCEPSDAPELEPACGDPVDNVNGGCGSPTLAFGTQLATPGSTICGTSLLSPMQWDTDWFTYTHPGGNIIFSITAEFAPQFGIVKPGPGATPAEQCYAFQVLTIGSGVACVEHAVALAAPPGVYWLWIGPDLSNNAAFVCGRAYRATVTSEAPPAGCTGDVDCDDVVNFFDIDPFVEALGYPGGAGWPHACPWANADCDGDSDVDFFDIDPFVARLGAACP